MEYIELDIKRIIYELLMGKIVPYSIELDREIPGTSLNRVYGTNVYIGEEMDGIVEVHADFNCRMYECPGSATENSDKGSFRGLFNIAQKCFVDEGACEVRF